MSKDVKNKDELTGKARILSQEFEEKREKEFVTLVATILVDNTLKNAAEKGYNIPEIQP